MFDSIGKAVEIAQRVGVLAQKVANLDLQEAVVELRTELVNVKMELVNLLEENSRLKIELATILTEQPETMKIGEYKMYFTETGDGPFCTSCFDVRGLKVRVPEGPPTFRPIYRYRCPECKAIYN
ncbi:MAG: hypothetical protein Q8K78_05745 [Planctomycetaceae bacterium]|nr:hypothetical protein [Planctomycetaceae bacterium]